MLADYEIDLAVDVARAPSQHPADNVRGVIHRLLHELGYSADGNRDEAPR